MSSSPIREKLSAIRAATIGVSSVNKTHCFTALCLLTFCIADTGIEPPAELLRIPGVYKQLREAMLENSALVGANAADALSRASAYQSKASETRLVKRGVMNENLKKAVTSKSAAKEFLAERAGKRAAYNDSTKVRIDAYLYKMRTDSTKLVEVRSYRVCILRIANSTGQIPQIKTADAFSVESSIRDALDGLLKRLANAHAEDFPLAKPILWCELVQFTALNSC
jgi:hypothetical protein